MTERLLLNGGVSPGMFGGLNPGRKLRIKIFSCLFNVFEVKNDFETYSLCDQYGSGAYPLKRMSDALLIDLLDCLRG